MDRKGFLQRIFGAAIVAAMPKVVVEQIEKTSPTVNGASVVVIQDGKIIPPEDTVVHHQVGTTDNVLFIFDENKLIGQSQHFSLNLKQDISPIYSKSRWVKVWTGKYKKHKLKKNGERKKKYIRIERVNTDQPDYWAAPKEWDIESENIQWFVNPEEIFAKGEKLNCLVKQQDIKLSGKIYISQMDISAAYLEGINHSARFIGNGELIIENDGNQGT
jgi:hypothetical protein